MLDGNDKNTFFSIRLLREFVDRHQKPVIIWVGAGVSKWCGFPTWKETAEHFHTNYLRHEPDYDRSEGLRLIQSDEFPEFFENLQQINRKRYNRELASLFCSRVPTPVYRRFLNITKDIAPLQIITTNVDETLEKNLSATATIQRSDLERCLDLVTAGDPFIAKLHGSVSSIESVVFSTSDYQRLGKTAEILKSMEMLFAQAAFVFVGYSLRDKYVLDLLAANCSSRRLFGDGPHFLIQAAESPALPDSIKVIRYLSAPYADHRSAMIVLDIIRVVREGGHVRFAPQDEAPPIQKGWASAHFISDVTPPGKWTSSQSVILTREDGFTPNGIIGQGFDDSELPEKVSPAMHDLTVGLVCFDHLYFPLSCASKLHDLLGSSAFWDLVKTDLFRFINFDHEPLMMFRSIDAVDGGDIGLWRLSGEDGKPLTVEEQIRKQFRAATGREAEVEELYQTLKENVSTFDCEKFNIPSLTRGALLHPSVRRLLGISDAILPSSMPRWVAFPVIRLAHVIIAGCACQNFALPATKIGFGSEILIGAAFAVSAAREWADSVSSYVLTSQFNTDLGAYVQSNPQVFRALLDFRDTQAGIDLRTEIMQELATNAGAEFVASVNAGLRHIVPTAVMENARDQLSGLLFRNSSDIAVVPAVWTSIRNSDSVARLWRAKSLRELEAYCKLHGIKGRHPCPCGSGDELRFCCAYALRE